MTRGRPVYRHDSNVRAYPDRKLLYLPHPRTASTAIEYRLDTLGFVDPAPGLDKHAPLSELREYTGQRYSDWTVATTVRNHFDALVSWSFVEGGTFGVGWLEAFADNCPYVTGDRLYPLHLEGADTVLRYESLERDLSTWLGGDVTLPALHVSTERQGRPYSEFYDETMCEVVTDAYGAEMDRLGYGWS